MTQASLWGLGRTIAEEHPSLWGGLIDLDPRDTTEAASSLLCDEMLGPEREDQIAYRQGVRHVARLVRYKGGASSHLRWRTDASYLITGGLGDLGLRVARWMVEQGARRLVLMGRTALPPRAAWKDLDPLSRTAHQIAAIRELELMGASVLPAAVDVADEAQMGLFFKTYEQENWPPIRGVVHAAGVVEGQPVAELETETLLRVMRPKLLGAWLLQRYLTDAPLDFFVLFSSGSSLLNSPLLGAYAAANALLDALAHERRAQGRPALSINWGFWSEVGMAARYLRENGREFAPHGMGTFAPEQGLEALGRLMRQDATEVCVMPIDWRQWSQYHPTASQSPVLAHLIEDDPGQTAAAHDNSPTNSRLSREELASARPEARAAMLEDALRQQVATVLKLSPSRINSQTPLIHLGIDSIMAIELKNRIESMLGIAVPIVTFLQGPSISSIASQMVEQLMRETEPITPVSSPAEGAPDGNGHHQNLTTVDGAHEGAAAMLIDYVPGDELNVIPDPGLLPPALVTTVSDDEREIVEI
jgi:NAD(P)-dependent dehydrogenase (short-subunit alcohol dehydrogenase family)/acyl carrier protein